MGQMIRRHVTALRLLFMAADGLTAVGLFAAVSVHRFGTTNWLGVWTAVGVDGWFLAAAYGLAWVVATWLLGLYRLRVRWSIRSELVDLVRADILVAVATFTVLFLFKLPNVSRLFLIELFLAQIGLSVAVRIAVRLTFGWARSHGRNTRWVLVVGSGPAAEAFADRLERHVELGLRVVGHLALGDELTSPGSPARPVLGSADDIAAVLHEHVIDEVAICFPTANLRLVEPIASLCQAEGRIVRIPLDDLGFALPGGRVEELDGLPILSLVYGSDRAIGLVLKRLLDIAIAAVALVVLSPILVGLALWIRTVDGPPVLFRQVRVGLQGRRFEVVKFRTMVPDAEARLAGLAARNEIRGPAFKLTDDPRLTRTGQALRRASLDELPQFLNVLHGQMSVVGPRPPLPEEVAGYDIWHRRRLSMKPGITGLWQVAARREQEFDRWVALDLDYIDRWSLWLDLKIMMLTVPAMLQGR
jgi:exopolysaccharide biosynthesis polyprenyl glycosylphosphotransferase